MQTFIKKYIGDKAFYRRLLSVMVPVLIQNVITNFVSLLDNIMVGTIGTESFCTHRGMTLPARDGCVSSAASVTISKKPPHFTNESADT